MHHLVLLCELDIYIRLSAGIDSCFYFMDPVSLLDYILYEGNKVLAIAG
jgi:hypothetical protein